MAKKRVGGELQRTEARPFYRMAAVPLTVDNELREQAQAAGIPLRNALIAIFEAVDLVAAVHAGQRRLLDFSKEQTKSRGFTLTVSLKDQIRIAALANGCKLGWVGRFVLMSLQGKIGAVMRRGISLQMRGAAKPGKPDSPRKVVSTG